MGGGGGDVTPSLLVSVVTLQLLSCLREDVILSLSGLCGDITTTVLSVGGPYLVSV